MYPKAGRYSLPSSPGTPRAHPSWPRHNSRVQQPLPGQLKILAAVTVFVVLAYFLLYPTLNKTEVEAVVPQFGGTVTSSENVDPSSPDQVDGGVLPEPSPTTKGRPKSKIESWREKIDSVNPWNHHKGNSTNVSNVRPSMVGTSSSPVPSPTLRAILSQALVRGSLPTELPVPSLSKPPPPPIRIVKISALFGDSSSAMQRALRTHEIHNRMHGYQMSVARRSILDDTWTKPAYILSIVLRELAKPDGEHAEWVFWVDADTIIINPYVQIEVFLPPAGEWDDVHMLVTKDWNGLNNGVFPLRVCQWSVEFLSAILAYRLYRPAADLTFRDQSAMDALLKEDRFSSHVLNVPQRWFNAYYGDVDGTIETYQIRRGEFLVHFPGLTDRDQLMEPWLQRAERHAPDWELELIHTTYPEEVEKFWEEARRERSNNIEKVEEVHQQCAELWEECEKWIRDWRIDFSLDVVNEIQGKIREVKEIVDGEMKARLEVVMNAYEDLRNVSFDISAWLCKC